MAIGRENHISIVRERSEAYLSLFYFSLDTTLIMISKSVGAGYITVSMQGIFSNKPGIPKIIDAQLHLANNLMFNYM
jgi:hypothetical protein